MSSQSYTDNNDSMDRGECQHAFFCDTCWRWFILNRMALPIHDEAENGFPCFSCGKHRQCGVWVSFYISFLVYVAKTLQMHSGPLEEIATQLRNNSFALYEGH